MTVNGKTEYWGNSYSYDAWGNLLGKAVTKCGAENMNLTADTHNWLHGPGTDYTYDAAGNMMHDATAGMDYVWDKENRLIGANGYSYAYDGDGNRALKSNANTAASGTLYWSMTPGIVAESDLAGTLQSEYIFFDGERVARKDFPGNTVAYYFSDHLKTASVITNTAGVITAESDYYPWGGELQFVNNDSNHYKFTSKERDSETGLDYFGARYYSNGLGRWLNPDWAAKATAVPYADFADPQSLNLYGYVRNIPTSNADPDGHDQEFRGTFTLWGTEELANRFWNVIGEPAKQFMNTHVPPHVVGRPPALPPGCTCPAPPSNNSNNNKQNNNNSQSSNQSESGGQTKKVPNPNGKKGDAAHQETIAKAEKDMQERGLQTTREHKIETPGGEKSSRYVDVAGKDAEGNVVEMHQAGRQTQAGEPVAREKKALNDIENATGNRPQFDPTNKPKE